MGDIVQYSIESKPAKPHQVHWSASTNASSKLALLEVPSYSAHWKLQTCLARPADLLLASSLSLTTTRHV